MRNYDEESKWTLSKVMKVVGFSFLGIFLLCTIWGSFYSVSPGHRGVMKVMSQVKDVSLAPGWGFKVPFFSEVIEMSVQTKVYTGTLDAYTNDMQNVTVEYVINYELIPDRVPRLYENVGIDYQETLLPGRIYDVTKSEFGDWKAQQLISDRPKVVANVQKAFREKLQAECNYFNNVIVQVKDLQFSKEFDKTNEDK